MLLLGNYLYLTRRSGSPPHWQNRPLPYTIPPDQGVQYCDQNGYKMPKAVLLPLIVAVNKRFEMIKEPAFNWSDIDIVTDRNNLRKLMRWATGGAEDFRIDLQLAGHKTVLMNRFSQKYKTMFSGRTYGFSFEKSSTLPAPGCKNSSGHHRIITYVSRTVVLSSLFHFELLFKDLSGLKVVVRFEVDACTRPPVKYPRRSTTSVDELVASLTGVSLGPHTSFRSEYPLLVREGGVEVPADTVIEIVTRSEANISRGYNWNDVYPQLFFSQTAQHYLAVHKYGRFSEITKKKTKEMQDIEQDSQPGFKKVRRVLDVIRGLVMKHGKEGGLSLVCKGGVMNVYERKSKETLLPDVAMKFFESA